MERSPEDTLAEETDPAQVHDENDEDTYTDNDSNVGHAAHLGRTESINPNDSSTKNIATLSFL